MKRIEVEGHSGCSVNIKKQQNELVIEKFTKDSKYVDRLSVQMKKQETACKNNVTKNIIVPKILDVDSSWDGEYHVIMEYVYGKNFIAFFEYADKQTIDNFIKTICEYVRNEIVNSTCVTEYTTNELYDKWQSVKSNMLKVYSIDNENTSKYIEPITNIIDKCDRIFVKDMKFKDFYVGTCHGDLTLSNIIFRDTEYALIDFLDSFIESPIMDIVKLRQDTKYKWSTLMYNSKDYDKTRYDIICKYIDEKLDFEFSKFGFYKESYMIFQLMNFLRIVQYAKKDIVTEYLINTINDILENFK